MKQLDLPEHELAVLRETFGRFPTIQRVCIFGSRANGSARRASDIDLAIFATNATPAEWSEISEALEEASVIFHMDIIRGDAAVSPRLRQKIETEGVRIYPE